MRNRTDEEENDQEAPADNEDAEAKGGKPEPEKREAGGLILARAQARRFKRVAVPKRLRKCPRKSNGIARIVNNRPHQPGETQTRLMEETMGMEDVIFVGAAEHPFRISVTRRQVVRHRRRLVAALARIERRAIQRALATPTSVALACRWRSRPQHQRPTHALAAKAWQIEVEHFQTAGRASL
jgi:hypothetical protein